jgi:hypothetical protein
MRANARPFRRRRARHGDIVELSPKYSSYQRHRIMKQGDKRWSPSTANGCHNFFGALIAGSRRASSFAASDFDLRRKMRAVIRWRRGVEIDHVAGECRRKKAGHRRMR